MHIQCAGLIQMFESAHFIKPYCCISFKQFIFCVLIMMNNTCLRSCSVREVGDLYRNRRDEFENSTSFFITSGFYAIRSFAPT